MVAPMARERSRCTGEAGGPEALAVSAAPRRTEPAEEMVRTVVAGVGPLGVTEDGVKLQTAPEGRPPVQAKLMVELKPPTGVAVRVTGFEVLSGPAVVEEAEGERVKTPTGSRTVRVAAAEVLA